MPFWGEALGIEQIACKRTRQMVETEPDPIMHDAIAMHAYEETVTPSSSRA